MGDRSAGANQRSAELVDPGSRDRSGAMRSAKLVDDLYSLENFAHFLAEGVRPDGRPLGRARPTSIGLGAVPTAEGSALVKIGNTTMLAGIKLEVMEPVSSQPDEGCIAVTFEMPPLCSPTVRLGKPTEAAVSIAEQIANTMENAGTINKRELCILPGKAAWKAFLDVYCVDDDGALFDAALLAAVASLADLRMPAVLVDEDGKVCPQASADGADAVGRQADEEGSHSRTVERTRLTLGPIPFSLTSGILLSHSHHGHASQQREALTSVVRDCCHILLVDPCRAEEELLNGTMTVVKDEGGRLISMLKPGGVGISTSTIQDCIEATRLRVKELQGLLKEALHADVEDEPMRMEHCWKNDVRGRDIWEMH